MGACVICTSPPLSTSAFPNSSHLSAQQQHISIFSNLLTCEQHPKKQQKRFADLLQILDKRHAAHTNPSIYGHLLQACLNAKSLVDCKNVHSQAVRCGLVGDAFLGNHVILMYLKAGSLVDARNVFDAMLQRNVVSWTVIVAAYVQHGKREMALQLFREMQLHRVMPNKVTFIHVLDSCMGPENLHEGKLIHAHIAKSGLESDVVLGTAIVNMYGRCGSIEDARRVFNKIHNRNVISWTTIIGVYAEHSHYKECIELFQQMQMEGVMPNRITFITILNACNAPTALPLGKLIHAQIIRNGLESNVVVGTSIIKMYGNCGRLEDACRVFRKMHQRNVISWTTIIKAYAEHGHYKEACELFQQMLLEGVSLSEITFVVMLTACASQGSLADGRLLHTHAVECSFESNSRVANSLINMYGKCGSLEDAQKMFDKMQERNVVSWTSIITAYTEHGRYKEALKLSTRMILEGVTPNKITFSAILDACAGLGALVEGKLIHECIVQNGFDSDAVIGTAVIKMYSKCGSIEDARKMFDGLSKSDVVTWNAMITSYAEHGFANKALKLFHQMQLEDVSPDEITFVSVLSACSRAGLVHEGCKYFNSMSTVHGIIPTLDHYGCLIDLLGRAGMLGEAENVINKMPFQPSATTWGMLLAACKTHGDMERGKHAAEWILELDPENNAAHVVLSNMYAAGSRWDDALNARKALPHKQFNNFG